MEIISYIYFVVRVSYFKLSTLKTHIMKSIKINWFVLVGLLVWAFITFTK